MFDPDAYLTEKTGTFDPDKYLTEKAGPAPGRNDAYPEDTTPSDVITTKPGKPVTDFTGSTRRVQEEIRRGAPGEDLATAEARANATQEQSNPYAGDPLARAIVENTVLGPVAGAVGGKILGGAMARSAARQPGAIKEAIKAIPKAVAGGHGMQGAALEHLGHMAGLPFGAGMAARGAPAAAKAAALGLDEGVAALGRGLGIGGAAAKQEAANAVSRRLASVGEAGEAATIRRRLAPLKSSAQADEAVADLPVNKLHESPSPFDAVGDDAPSTELPTKAGIPVVPSRPTLAPLTPQLNGLSPRQLKIVADVEKRYGAKSAEQVASVMQSGMNKLER